MNSNSENPRRGKAFQEAVKEWFETSKQHQYELERPIPIGNPSKPHKFDIVEANGKVVIECKCYTWTESGNVPSAKMGFTNEAAFYLSFLPDTIEKIIVMSRSTHPRRNETLAEYYYRSKISRNYWLFEPKCRNNAEIIYTQRLQIASYFP